MPEETQKNILTHEQFIALFPKTRFRYIHDTTGDAVRGNDTLDPSQNGRGYGVFFTVNGFPATGKATVAKLESINGNYVDFDVDPSLPHEEKDKLIQESLMSGIEAGAPVPTIINRTKNGAHFIWLYPEPLEPTPQNVSKWNNLEKRIIACFNGDNNATDIVRVLRLPYTMHLKDPSDPFEVKVAEYKPDSRFTLEELDLAVPKTTPQAETIKASATEVMLNGVKVGEGLRHMALAQVAGLALKNAKTPEQVELARLAMYGWDRTVVKSPESFDQRKKEIDNTIDGILKKEMQGRPVAVKPRVWTMGEIIHQDFGEHGWLVESLISNQGITAFSGNPGDFKTWITIHVALCMSRELKVFGKFQATKGAVLIIDEEDHLRILKKRLGFLGAKENDSIYYLSQCGIKVDKDDVLDTILELVKEKNIKLVVLDSLIRVHGQDENDAGGMAKVFNNLQKIIVAGASILFTHHHRKQIGHGPNNGQSMRGSSDILAALDCHTIIEKKRDIEDTLVVRQTKLRDGEMLKPFEVKILKEATDDKGNFCPSGFEYVGEHDQKKEKTIQVAEALPLVLADGMRSRQEIIDELSEEYGRDLIEAGIKTAEENGSIELVPKEELPKADRRKNYYRLLGTSAVANCEAEDQEEDTDSRNDSLETTEESLG